MNSPPHWYGVVAFLLGVGLVVQVASGPLESLVGSEARLFKAVNAVRHERRLLPLETHRVLAKVARAHARDMAHNGYLSHVNPRGENPLDRARAAGVNGLRLLAENLAASSESSDRIRAVVDHWLASPEHRENLLNPAFHATGLAVVETDDGRTLAVQLYATFDSSRVPEAR